MSSLHDFLASADHITEAEDSSAAGRATPGVRVQVQRLNKYFGTHHVLRDLDLTGFGPDPDRRRRSAGG